jgi:hypothetical protein
MRKPSGTSTVTAVTEAASAVIPTVTVAGSPTGTSTGAAHACAAAGATTTSGHSNARMTGVRRILVTVATALMWLIALAPPAAAHSVAGADATNFDSRIIAVTPQLPGIDVEVIENGNRMQLTNTSDEPVVVLGYQGEPYLRVGPDGVFENRRSPATYLNEDRQATTPVPGIADPDADPDWNKTSDGDTARWHDHRVHWMGDQDPPAVRRNPDQRHVVIPEWVVPIRAGDTTIDVTGQLLWIPGPSPWPWIALAVALFAATAAAGLAFRHWRVAVAMLLALLVAVDVAHAAGVGLSAVGGLGTQIGQIFAGSYLSLVGWVAGIAGVVLLIRDREEGLYAAGFAATFIALNGGLVDLGELSRSFIPFAWPGNLARAAIAISLGIGFGLLAVTAIHIIRPRHLRTTSTT